MLVELKIPIDLYKELEEGPLLIKRNVRTKQLVDTLHISNPKEILSDKGKVIKNQCQVLIKDIGIVTLGHSYKYIKRILQDKQEFPEIIGFGKWIKEKQKVIKTKK